MQNECTKSRLIFEKWSSAGEKRSSKLQSIEPSPGRIIEIIWSRFQCALTATWNSMLPPEWRVLQRKFSIVQSNGHGNAHVRAQARPFDTKTKQILKLCSVLGKIYWMEIRNDKTHFKTRIQLKILSQCNYDTSRLWFASTPLEWVSKVRLANNCSLWCVLVAALIDVASREYLWVWTHSSMSLQRHRESSICESCTFSILLLDYNGMPS